MFVGFAVADLFAQVNCKPRCLETLGDAMVELARVTREDAATAPRAHAAVAHAGVRAGVACLAPLRERGLGGRDTDLRAAWSKQLRVLRQRAPQRAWARAYRAARLASLAEALRRGARACALPPLPPERIILVVKPR
jgi:hypothetical protein